jgi:pimeloyl-ACP methyl ester carboxylesterase
MSRPDFREQVVPLGDASLYVRRLPATSQSAPSTGPVLVFLHDSLGCVDTWRDFPEELAGRVRLNAVNYDRQGYGRSSAFGTTSRTPEYLEEQATVLFALLDALGIETVVLFGHSDGGSIALIAAGVQPQRVAAVVTEGAHVFVEDVTLAGVRAAREAFATTDLPERLARYHGEKVQGVAAAWIETWLAPAFRTWSIERYLPAIVCPVLAIQGQDDEYGTMAQVRAIVDGARAESLVIPGVGHTPHRDARDGVLAAAAEFITRAVRRRSGEGTVAGH